MRLRGLAVAALLVLVGASRAQALVLLTFEGVGDLNPVGNFYNGGAGPNYHIGFSPNTFGLVDSDAGGSGNFGGEPSPDTVIYFDGAGPITMNVFNGFSQGLGFYYAALFGLEPHGALAGRVRIWSGLSGTGSILGQINLLPTPHNGGLDPTGEFSPLVLTGTLFDGIAASVTFEGFPQHLALDNIILGPVATPVPEPSTLLLLGAGLSALALRRRSAR